MGPIECVRVWVMDKSHIGGLSTGYCIGTVPPADRITPINEGEHQYWLR